MHTFKRILYTFVKFCTIVVEHNTSVQLYSFQCTVKENMLYFCYLYLCYVLYVI